MTDAIKSYREAYAIIGELVLTANALDYELNRVLIAVMHLDDTPMLLSVIATLDPVRKIEMLKTRTKHISSEVWGGKLREFTGHLEDVFRQRNIACHSTPSLSEDGEWSLVPVAAAKMLKALDPITGEVKSFRFDDLKTAIDTARVALGKVPDLIQNFERLNKELSHYRTK